DHGGASPQPGGGAAPAAPARADRGGAESARGRGPDGEHQARRFRRSERDRGGAHHRAEGDRSEHRPAPGGGDDRRDGGAVLPLLTMLPIRSVVIAVAVAAVLWLALDSGRFTTEPAQPGTSAALGMLAAVFGVGALVMQV